LLRVFTAASVDDNLCRAFGVLNAHDKNSNNAADGYTFPGCHLLNLSESLICYKLRIAEERVGGNERVAGKKKKEGPCWGVIPVNMAAHVTHVPHSQPTTVSIHSRMNIRGLS
jgi:hypothetical protein